MTKDNDGDGRVLMDSERFLGLGPAPCNQPSETMSLSNTVLRIEELYRKIDVEITGYAHEGASANDVQIEIWSQEIETLCQKVDNCPIENASDLRAKIALHLSLISKSFLDMRSIEMHSDKILNVLDEYNNSSRNPALRIVK